VTHDPWRIARLALRTLLYAALLSALVWVLGTDAGLDWVWHMAKPWLPRDLQVASVSGRLIGPITVKGVDYRSATLHVTLKRARLQWSPLHLLVADLDVPRLDVAGLDVERLKSASAGGRSRAAKPVNLAAEMHLPVFVHVGRLRLSDFRYQAGPKATPFTIKRLQLAARYDQSGAHISDLQLVSPRIDAHGALSVGPRAPHPVDAKVRWQLRVAGYAAVPGTTRLSGSLSELIVDQRLAAPYHVHAHVRLSGPMANLHWRGSVRVDGLQLQQVAERLQPMSVSLQAQGAGGLKQLHTRLSAQLDSPRYGKLHAQARASYAGHVLSLHRVLLQVPDRATRVELQGNVALAKTPRVSAQATWRSLAWPLKGAARFSSPQGRLHVDGTLDHAVAGLQAQVGGGGTVNATLRRAGERLSAWLDWHGLRYPMSKAPRVTSPQGHAALTGRMDDYQLELAADLALPKRGGGHVQLSGHSTQRALQLTRLKLDALKGQVSGSGRLVWKPAPEATLNLKGSGLDPGELLPRWQGKLAVALQADARLSGGEPQGRVQQLKVHGRLRGEPFKLDVKGRYAKRRLALAKLDLLSGRNHLAAHGTAGRKRVDVQWRIDAPRLGQLLPRGAGSVRGHGRIRGAFDRPRAQISLQAHDLHYAAYQLGKLAVDGDVDLTGAQRSTLDLSLSAAQAAGTRISSASLKASGRPADQTLRLAVNSSRGDAQLRLRGGVDRAWSHWQGRLQEATLSPAKFAAWHLRAPAGLTIGKKGGQLQHACWRSGSAQLCVQGQRSAQGTQAAFTLDALPIAYLQPLLPQSTTLEGRLSGQGRIKTRPGQPPSADAQLKLSNGALLQSGDNGAKRKLLGLEPSHASLTLGPKGLHLTADLALAQGGMHAQVHVAPGARALAQRPLQGRVQVQLNSLDFASALVTTASNIKGRVKGDLTLGGTLAAPKLDGSLNLDKGRAKLIPAGIEVTGVSLQLRSRGHQLTVKAQAHSGGGKLSVSAQGEVGAHNRVTAKVDGQGFRVMNTAVAQVEVSPQLDIAVQGKRIRVNGQVKVPRADITPHQLPNGSSAVTVSSDQVIVQTQSGKPAKLAPSWRIEASVRLILGDHVNFKGFGLQAKLGGSLLTNVEPGKPPSGSGQLVIEKGHYQAYGQDLTIKNGRILFAGPLSQPGVDVRATRQPRQGILVGVHVKGPLKNPQLQLFSDPSMGQNQQLSWLVLGRPLNSNSGQDNAALAQAALALGIKGGNFLAGSLGKELGLNGLSIESGPLAESQAPTGSANPFAPPGGQQSPSTGQQAALTIGKYLSPKLYVSYGLGLLQQAYVVKLKYLLSSKFTLQTEASSVASGVDLLYSIERGNP